MEEKNLHVRIVPMTADHLDEVAELARICFSTPWSRNMLEVRASNYPAIALYGSRGFRGVGRRKNYYEHPREDAIIMTREFEQHGTENPVS